jgi:hypothetical protein
VIEVGGQQIEAKTQATGSWTSFETKDLSTVKRWRVEEFFNAHQALG